jgi:hypothetical protein
VVRQAQPNTYQTVRIPLVGNHTNRLASASKDQIFYNVIIDGIKNALLGEKAENRIFISKRGAFVADTTVVVGGGVGRGVYYWERNGKVYSVVDDKLYATSTSIKTLGTSTGTCWFVEATGSTDVLIMCDGAKLYSITTADVVTDLSAADADIPATPVTPISIDGYVIVVKSGTDEIYNSNVDAPSSWTAGDFLTAEMYPDNVVAIARHVNYILGFGSFSTEVFYDAANASGSPLARNEGISFKVGLAARDSMAQTDRRFLWVGQSQTGECSVWILDGLDPKKASNEFIDKILSAEGSAISSAKAFVCHHKGHTLYIVNLTSRTLVYDVDEKVWFDWSTNSASTHAVLPYSYCTQGSNEKILVLHNTDGKIYKLDGTSNQDDAGAILCHIVTSKIDMGNAQQKRQFRFELIADKESTGTVSLEWTDDDYQNWSSARTLDLTTRPFYKSGGVFRRRAFRLKHESNGPFRAEAIELDYSTGVH